MALATGSQHMNLLAPASGATAGSRWRAGSAGGRCRRVGRRAHRLLLAATRCREIRGRVDRCGGCGLHRADGFVGSPVAGAYVRQALTDVDYIRRVTFNVALVSQVSCDGTYACRAIAGRRAGGGRQAAGGHGICGPRRRQLLSGVVGTVCHARQPGGTNLLSLSAAAGDERRGGSDRCRSMRRTERAFARAAKGQFLALPVTDPLDGERVVCYRSFLPAANALGVIRNARECSSYQS